MTAIRPAAVAGFFYPGKADELENTLARMLAAAEIPADAPAPKALIVPHAGYIYSGPCAAQAYARLAPMAGRITRVVLLGPCHRVAVRGLATTSASPLRWLRSSSMFISQPRPLPLGPRR